MVVCNEVNEIFKTVKIPQGRDIKVYKLIIIQFGSTRVGNSILMLIFRQARMG
jgi:hypothetical protein